MSTAENQTEKSKSLFKSWVNGVSLGKILKNIPFPRKKSIPQQDAGPSIVMMLSASSDAGPESTFQKEVQPLPIIGRMSEKNQYRVVISCIALTIFLSAGSGFIASALSDRMSEIKSDLLATSQIMIRLTGTVQSATDGSAEGFSQSEKAEIEALSAIADLGSYAKTSLTESETASIPVAEVEVRWSDFIWNAIVAPFIDLTPRIRSALSTQDAFNKILTYQPIFGSYGKSGARLHEITDELLRKTHQAQNSGLKGAESFETDIAALSSIAGEFVENGGSSFSADQFETFRLRAINHAPDAKSSALLQEILAILTDSLKPVAESVSSANEIIAHEMTSLMGDAAIKSGTASKDLTAPLDNPVGLVALWVLAGSLLALAALQLAVLLLIGNRSSELSAYAARKKAQETDEAVRMVMTELRPISRGDLVKRVTVVDNDLSTVSDRINLTIESIQETLAEVKLFTRAAEGSIEEIFEQAQKSTDITESASLKAIASVEASEKGAEAVSIAVERTQKQRTSMQDVAKRMKRLGEVAQSITRVTDLIEEVTAKTEVLAINTALKAADAGEEGAAFRVIAEEIRKLTSDTKRSLGDITTAVQSMQAETQSVIQNVEGVTAELVDSSKFWDGAMSSLTSIGRFAEDMKSLMVSITDSSNLQAKSAADAVTNISKLTSSAMKFRTDVNEEASS